VTTSWLYTSGMTVPKESEIIMQDADGWPTDDKAKAVGAEIINISDSGEEEHVLMVAPGQRARRGLFDE